MTNRDCMGRVAWRQVASVDLDQHTASFMYGHHTLRAALLVAQKASDTYPTRTVFVMTGKRIGRTTAIFEGGRMVEQSREQRKIALERAS